ncbi:MAG: type 11 methyltransferase [uncultured bacterium (gcode 4)]|uniref:Type 11 methyltransferase n=1 Tax=uncultured bacterium (gcode 4) TaxID=1234023 RepID=K2GG93_9BACT|nr:MAG: type 11 methyltransferase [uncultured bacterium (gcode 4)]
MVTNEQTLYDKFAEEFARKFNAAWVRTDDIRRAFSYFDNPEDLSVFEVWCWNWRDVAEILKYTNNYIWLDYSEWMLDIAKKQLPEAKFELGDIEEYESEEKFDIIFSFASLVHLPIGKVEKVLSKLHWMLNAWWILILSLRYWPEYKEEIISDEIWDRFFTLYNGDTIRGIMHWFDSEFERVYKVNKRLWLVMDLRKI